MAEQRHSTNLDNMFAKALSGLDDTLLDFQPAPRLSDRAFWSSRPESLSARILADAESAKNAEWPSLSARAYRTFSKTGNRIDFETVYFCRRRRLNTFALAEAMAGNGQFIDQIIDGIVLICEESGWQLPAHNSQIRDGAFDPLPDPDRPVVDLFAAETGAQLAVIAWLFGEALERACPGLVKRIDREIAMRITIPYLNRHFWWMGDGDAKMNNWTAWCTQNVLISTFSRPTDPETRRAVITKAAHSLDAFAKDYGEDGACEEGPLYYRHAALCLFGALSVMDAVAPGVFSHLWHEAKLRNMAEFILNSHVTNDSYINFADSQVVLEPCGAREFLFGQKTGSNGLCALAASHAARNPRPDLPEEINLSYRLQALTAADAMAGFKSQPIAKRDMHYPSCGLFIARDDTFTVAAKAGNNDDGHNHNDVGSITVYKNGQPVLIDVGVGTYTRQTFSPERYQIWTMQSAYHNLPTFEGVQQEAGEAFAARDVTVEMDSDFAAIDMEIAGAYPAEAGLSSYKRNVRLEKGHGIAVTDTCAGAKRATLSLMVAEVPEIGDDRVVLGDLAIIKLSGNGPLRVEAIDITDPRLRESWPAKIYRLLIPLAKTRLRLEIA